MGFAFGFLISLGETCKINAPRECPAAARRELGSQWLPSEPSRRAHRPRQQAHFEHMKHGQAKTVLLIKTRK